MNYNAIYIYSEARFTTNSTLEAISNGASIQVNGTTIELTPGIYRAKAPVGLTPIGTPDYNVTTYGGKGNPPVDPPLRAQQVFNLSSTQITQMLTNGLAFTAAV